MSLRELVTYIQSTYPPPGSLPGPNQQADAGDLDAFPLDFQAGFPPNLPPAQRPPLPDWLQPGQGGLLIPRGSELTVGEASSEPPQAQPGDMDVLAYYLPFHFYRRNWGIYLRESGILSIGSMLASAGGAARDTLTLARAVLVQHEMFHFLSEVACSQAEIASHQALYPSYFLDRYATPLEEALSNARAIRMALRGQPMTLKKAVESWMLSQGVGYRDFERWVTRSQFSRGCRLATVRMLCRVTGHTGREPAEFLYAGISWLTPPTYLVHDVAIIDILKPFPKYHGLRVLVHSRDHPPPHIHVQMPPGRDFTRLEWPTLDPLKGDPDLSGSERRALDSYLAAYGEQIAMRVRAVYPSAA